MADPIQGLLNIQTDPGGMTRIVLDPNMADITAGGNGGGGDLILKNAQDKEVVRLGRIKETVANPQSPTQTVIAGYTGLRIRTANGVNLIQIGRMAPSTNQYQLPDEIAIIFGGSGFTSTLRLVDKNNKTRFIVGRHDLGGNEGDIIVRDGANQEVFHFDGDNAVLRIGNKGNKGDIIVRDGAGQDVFHFESSNAVLYIGSKDNAGDINVRDANERTVLKFDSTNAALKIGDKNNAGNVIIRGSDGNVVFHLNGDSGNISVNDNNDKGVFQFFSENAALYIGDESNAGNVIIRDSYGKNSISLDGAKGDIFLTNADCAEDFDISESEEIEPGTVMVIDQEGKLQQSRDAYDKKVAGVISGAGDYKPGIILDKQSPQTNRLPIALVGKAYCKVDAQYSPIEVGDLLTTSQTPGHAMKASDPLKAFGAVIGKALRPLEAEQGLIPILIALQ